MRKIPLRLLYGAIFAQIRLHRRSRLSHSLASIQTNQNMHIIPAVLRRLRNASIALGLTALCGVSVLRAQTATIGYDPLANTGGFIFKSFTASTAYVVPFQFNTLGDYSINSVSLLLRGDADLADFTLSVSTTLPSDLTAPTSLTTFSTTGTLSGSDVVYSFSSGATPTLAANTTYYLRVGYNGANTANWIATSGGGVGVNNYGAFVFNPVSGAVFGGTAGYGGLNADPITYRSLTSGGFNDSEATMGGFSLTASAVSVIPEPAAYASLVGAVTLAAALFVRRRRQNSSGPAS